MSEALTDLAAYLAEKLGAKIAEPVIAYGELAVTVEPHDLIDVLSFLKRDVQCQFVSFIDVCGADYPARERRFDVVYHLLSPRQNQRIRVKVLADEETMIPSATAVFPGADWYERETYDLYGVLFSGHPDLRRILTDYGFDGPPLSKDFPLTGFVVVRDDDEVAVGIEHAAGADQPIDVAVLGAVGRWIEDDVRLVGGELAVGLVGEVSLRQRQAALQRHSTQVEGIIIGHVHLPAF